MITNIVAIIGCITGVISLTLNLIRSWNERFDVRVHFYEPENMFFNRLHGYGSYHTDYQGIVRVRFENRSSDPITVFSATLSADGQPVFIREYEGLSKKILLNLGDHHSGEISLEREIHLPLRIDSYDAVEGYMFIPFFPTISKDIAPLTLSVQTTKKDLVVNSQIHYVGPQR